MWRYYPEDRLLDLLRTSEMFFTNLPAFSDRLEGLLTARSRQRLLHWFLSHGSDLAGAHEEVQHYEKARSSYHASCWHMNDHESYLMWKAYADRGYAISTTFERVQTSFERFPGVITGGEVDYVDFSRDDPELGNTFTLAITKDMPYRDEREFRLLFWQPEPRNAGHPLLPKGVRVSVDLRLLVGQIYVSPLIGSASPEVSEAVGRLGVELISSGILSGAAFSGGGAPSAAPPA
jgi:hypothetical protein